jgi:hypothetical protein
MYSGVRSHVQNVQRPGPILLEIAGRRRRVERQRCAVAVERQVAEPQRHVALGEWDAGVPGRRDDPAPVRVGAVDGGFHQRAVSDGFRDAAGVGVVG